MRVVCFLDAFGTLIHPDPDAATVYALFGQAHGDLREPAVVRRELVQALRNHGDTARGIPTTATQEKDRWRSIVRDSFSNLSETESLFEELWDYFSQPAHWNLFPDVADGLARLRDAGVAVGIASNFDQRLHPICRGLFPLSDVRWIWTSADLGWRKPATQFFQALTEKVDLPASHCWYVGDDYANDVAPARAAGWRAALLNRGSSAAIETPPDIPHIENLTQLAALLVS